MGIATLIKSAQINSPELHILTNEELKSLHGLLIEMMNDIAKICAENEICWMLGGGSALGAVRHKGFIPWDDDMDLNMPRGDFEKFKTVFPGKFAEKYELKTPGDSGYLYHFPKIYRKDTVLQNIQSPKNGQECISIDIFIMENTSNSKLLRTMHGMGCNALLLIDSIVRMGMCKENLLKYGANSPRLCKAVKKRAFFSIFFRFLRLEQWLKISDKVFALCNNSDSDYITIPSGNGHYFGELFLREKMQMVKEAVFEGESYFLPADPDYYLGIRYGKDYMKIPAKNEREQHIFIKFCLEKSSVKDIF